jgi:F0F1-type ATP synthase assembly protein I
MQSTFDKSGDLSQESSVDSPHLRPVTPKATGHATPSADGGKRFYRALSASSVGLELGISVLIGVLFGMWLDGQLGTEPWMMLLFMVVGFIAGFRGVLHAVRKADREASRA